MKGTQFCRAKRSSRLRLPLQATIPFLNMLRHLIRKFVIIFAMEIPATSISLLKDLSSGTAAARWTEFYRRYEPVMRAFLQLHFPSVDSDDAIQESMVALMKALPEYRYTPDRNGHFRNYLVGIVRHKALDALRRENVRNALKSTMAEEERERMKQVQPMDTQSDDGWRHSAMEAALEQVLEDDSIAARTREVFRHVALMHEQPEDVARQFGITRNSVDQIKSRMIARLAGLVKAMTA